MGLGHLQSPSNTKENNYRIQKEGGYVSLEQTCVTCLVLHYRFFWKAMTDCYYLFISLFSQLTLQKVK